MTRVCYFTNVYPAPSHTTMRREILALEALGAVVVRVAARRFNGALVDPSDFAEARVTAYTTESLLRAIRCVCIVAFKNPRRLARAMRDAATIGSKTRAGIWKHLMYVGEACVLLQLARECDYIHANFSNATSIATLCRVLGGPSVSLRIHGPEEFERFTVAEWEWKIYHSCFVASISEYGARKIRSLIRPQHHFKIRTLRCGIEASLHSPVNADFSPLPRSLRLVCVARLEPRKGHNVLFEAVRVLRREGLPVSLLLVGDGTQRATLEQRVRELSICDGVEFAGMIDGAGVITAMLNARVVVLPSFAEGLPIVIMEALALGRAVVATNVAGVSELVTPGQTGWLVGSGDARGLATALREALLSPDEDLLKMARAGRAVVAERHDVDQLMRDLLSYMHHV